MNHYGFISKFISQDGKRTELEAILLQAAASLKTNSACLAYIVHRSVNDNEIIVNEIWVNKQSHDDSLAAEDIKQLITSALPLLNGKPEVIAETTVLGGKGFSDK